jgi:hypothetical protein
MLSDYDMFMELRFPEWEKIINEGKLSEVRNRILQKLEVLEKQLNSSYTSDSKEEIMRIRKAFLVLLKFQEELLELKEGMKK